MAEQRGRGAISKEVRRQHREWAEWVRLQAESGRSQEQFCREHGLPFWRFKYWKYERLPELDAALEDTTVVDETQPCFLPVVLAPPRRGESEQLPAGCGVEVLLPDGLRIGLSTGFDQEVLRRAVDALRC